MCADNIAKSKSFCGTATPTVVLARCCTTTRLSWAQSAGKKTSTFWPQFFKGGGESAEMFMAVCTSEWLSLNDLCMLRLTRQQKAECMEGWWNSSPLCVVCLPVSSFVPKIFIINSRNCWKTVQLLGPNLRKRRKILNVHLQIWLTFR